VQKQARITSKGQITVPRDIRRTLGVRPGDRLLFESDGAGVRIRPLRVKSPFEKYRGIGNPGIPPAARPFATGFVNYADDDHRHR
jgi:AbrB family looped-hinge helix DNA binding protein